MGRELAADISGVLADWLARQPSEWRGRIGVAALDPFRGYGAALSAELPHAVRVLDPFHVVRLGFACVDDVRRRVQQHTHGHRGRRGGPLYGIRRVLRRAAENLTTTAWARLLAGIEAGDEGGQVAAAWVAAQELRAIYRCRDRDHAAQRLYDMTGPSHVSTPASPKLAGWHAPSPPGAPNSWPTSAQAASATDPPKRSTC